MSWPGDNYPVRRLRTDGANYIEIREQFGKLKEAVGNLEKVPTLAVSTAGEDEFTIDYLGRKGRVRIRPACRNGTILAGMVESRFVENDGKSSEPFIVDFSFMLDELGQMYRDAAKWSARLNNRLVYRPAFSLRWW
jgi:hypothetical protein